MDYCWELVIQSFLGFPNDLYPVSYKILWKCASSFFSSIEIYVQRILLQANYEFTNFEWNFEFLFH